MSVATAAPELPAAGAYLLAWWSELSQTRGSGVAGAAPICYAEIEAWARVTRRRLSPWEAAVLRRIDDAFMRSLSDG